jgi:glycosyltransferase involved in cell wall biosynthesis
MKIAIFASAFYPHVGGVEELVRQLGLAYRRNGDEAIVLTNRWPRDLPAHEIYEGIPVYRLAMRVPEGSVKARLNYRLTHGKIRSEMLEILRRHQIDMLHIQCVSSNGYYALLAKQELKLPLVMTTQGERTMDAGQIYQTSTFMNANLRELLKTSDYITACSQNTLKDMEDYFREQFKQPSKVVYNGIQLGDFCGVSGYAHPRPYILGIGRLVPQKGFDVLLQAFARSKQSSHDLLLAGEGPERENLEALTTQLKLGERVKFLGRADRPTAVALFKGCSFFVLPSRHEPQGIVNLEAMASGKAVIASRVGGVPEIVTDEQTGILVPGEDVVALSAAIDRLCDNDDLRERLGTAGQERAQQFDWPLIAGQYQEIYRSLISANNSSAGVLDVKSDSAQPSRNVEAG